jgi:vancomycin resistance protein YoaR
VLTLLAIALFAASFALGYSKMHERTVLPGVQVAGVDLAGLDRRAAELRIRSALPNLSAGELTVRVGDREGTISYAEFDRDYDMKYMLDEAFGIGRTGSLLDQLREQVALLLNGAEVEPVMTWDSQRLAAYVAELAMAAQVPVVDAAVARVNGHYVATEASDGLAIDVQGVVTQAMAAVHNLSADDAEIVVDGTVIVPAVATATAQAAAAQAEQVIAGGLPMSGEDLTATIDPQVLSGWIHLDEVGVGQWELKIEPDPITQYVATYSTEVEVPATNATFAVNGGNIDVVPSAPGRAVDVGPTASSVLSQLQARAAGQAAGAASISFTPIEPTLTTEQARDIAPRVTKLGEWTTFYTPDPEHNGNGVNIQIPTNILDGDVVEPGASFDFLTAIGPITSPPYETGGALIHGQIKEDSIIGGGMCSVSTTLFNAAMRFGLPVWAWDNHSIYISRYPVGLDATVWSTSQRNRQTMGFVNDTGYPLVIRGINGPGSVTFEIYGVDDGRTVELTEPRIENIVKTPYMLVEYTNDLPAGRRNRINDAYDAFDAWVTRTVRDASGAVIIEETYHAHYKQLPAYVRVGRGEGDPRDGRVVRVRIDVTNPPNPE